MRPILIPPALWATLASSACLSSLDGSLTACFNGTGAITSLAFPFAPSSTPFQLTSGGTVLENALRVGTPTMNVTGTTTITVSQAWTFLPPAPPNSGALVVDTFTSAATSIAWDLEITPSTDGEGPWSVPIVTTLGFTQGTFNRSKLWAPWDRGAYNTFPSSWTDPLQPSDVRPSGWWTGEYRLGTPRGSARVCDWIIAPLATVLSEEEDTGVTLALSPLDTPLDVLLLTFGDNPSQASLGFHRSHARMDPTNPTSLKFHMDLVGHLGDWRASLEWATVDGTQKDFWEPVNPEAMVTCGGLGSYSYYGDDPADSLTPYLPALENLSYAVNWDLSGRYFPYMGQFLPPVGPDEVWLNDAEGTQPRANISYSLIGSWYREMASHGFLDLSYFNVNEYGINVELPKGKATRTPSPPASKAGGTCATSWRNASQCMIENFLSAAVMRAWDELDGSLMEGPIYSWQNAIVVDPGDESYHAFLLEQLVRHIIYEDAFAGIIIDRSDWMSIYDLDGDDGLTFLPEAAAKGLGGAAASLKLSYARMVADLRGAMAVTLQSHASGGPAAAAAAAATPLGDGVMLQNTLGNGRLDMFRHFDGQFSEGYGVNGVGLLGLLSPAILWTYDSTECCSTPAAAASYFQHHLYMGVNPMNPFPGNDHAIAWDVGVAGLYARYGPLFGALRARTWALLPHIVSLSNGTSNTPAKVNAFVVPMGAETGMEPTLVLSVMLGGGGSGMVAGVNVSHWDRVWATAPTRHPLLRKRGEGGAAAAAGGAAGTPTTYTLEQLTPGVGNTWGPLPGTPTFSCAPDCSAVLPVQLVEGCAMVRIRAQ